MIKNIKLMKFICICRRESLAPRAWMALHCPRFRNEFLSTFATSLCTPATALRTSAMDLHTDSLVLGINGH